MFRQLIVLSIFAALFLSACGGSTSIPPLAVPDQPTFVLISAEN